MLRVTLVQSSLQWEKPEANREMFAEKLAGLAGTTDLVVLPEMFSTGFSMNAEKFAEPMTGATMQWLASQAKKLEAAVIASFICQEESRFYNRLIMMRPDGNFDYYDKKHLFTLAGEGEHFSPGRSRLALEWKGWRICPLICYDLRFPVWSRNMRGSFFTGLNPYYDLLLYVANWPAKRSHHWRSLLTARAIENQAFVVGVNIVGQDGNQLDYTGDSMVIDYSGQAQAHLGDGQEQMVTLTLDKTGLDNYRKDLPFLLDGDVFEFKG